MGSGDPCELQEDFGGNLTEECSCVLCDLGKSLSYATLPTCTPKLFMAISTPRTHDLSSKTSVQNTTKIPPRWASQTQTVKSCRPPPTYLPGSRA